ncbi:hypothetical protein [Taibaiella chishuiensis]|uniref:hypothetical protein n=1 Tax=Taibaiella chishuiensis TaxID=1434707 RepID=UPI0011B1DB97|nr:hypothetical protein [Taibaiella chishuiensis]
MEKDSTINLYRVSHFIKGNFLKKEKGTIVYDLLGEHYTKQFTDTTGVSKVLVLFFDKNDNLLFEFHKRYDNFELGNLKFANPFSYPPGQIASLTEVAGLAVRDTQTKYTFFVFVSKNGVSFPVNIRKSGSKNLQPKLDIHSILKNDIESIYLFDSKFSIIGILKFSQNSITVTAIKKEVKSLKMECGLECIKKIDLSQIIDIVKTAEENGEITSDFRIRPGWLVDTDD